MSQNFNFAFLAIFTNPTGLSKMAVIHNVNGLETEGVDYEV